jgi:hypothetical protein
MNWAKLPVIVALQYAFTLKFIHNWVIRGIQWMMCRWVLVPLWQYEVGFPKRDGVLKGILFFQVFWSQTDQGIEVDT